MVFKGENDIALIRLAKDVEFTKYIQPICLPFSVKDYVLPSNETNFTLAGWGSRRFTFNNDILEFLEIPFFPFDECEQVYEFYERDLTDNSICAGGVPGENFCYKDGGGPLMRTLDDIWVLDGIITKTTDDECATKTPGVFTNVLKYERWIKEHIIYGWEAKDKGNDAKEERTNSWNSFGKVVSNWRFWILVVILLSIVALMISCCFMVSKFWKTHSTCITFVGILISLIITGSCVLLYFL